MNIFLADRLPVKIRRTSVKWINRKNWAIEIDGEILYGAGSENDIEKCLIMKYWRL